MTFGEKAIQAMIVSAFRGTLKESVMKLASEVFGFAPDKFTICPCAVENMDGCILKTASECPLCEGTGHQNILDQYVIDWSSVPDGGLSLVIYSREREEAWEIDFLDGWRVRDVSSHPHYQQMFRDYWEARDAEAGCTRRDEQDQLADDKERGK